MPHYSQDWRHPNWITWCKVFLPNWPDWRYHQIKLDPNSRNITTFATHQGLYWYKRFMVYINLWYIQHLWKFSETDIEIISGCPKAKSISDDIVIWGNTLEEHNKNLKILLQRILESGLKINPQKCTVTKIIFNGHILSAEGILPDCEKIKSISQLQVPTNITEIKPLLGMTNFCNKFIPDYSTITAPLQQLT